MATDLSCEPCSPATRPARAPTAPHPLRRARRSRPRAATSRRFADVQPHPAHGQAEHQSPAGSARRQRRADADTGAACRERGDQHRPGRLLAADQRGVARQGACDSGAYEFVDSIPPNTRSTRRLPPEPTTTPRRSRSRPPRAARRSSAVSTARHSARVHRRSRQAPSVTGPTPFRCGRPTRRATPTLTRRATPSRWTPCVPTRPSTRPRPAHQRHHPHLLVHLQRRPAPPSSAASTAPRSAPAPRRSPRPTLSEGSHTFQVRATDQAGNVDRARPATPSPSTPCVPTPPSTRRHPATPTTPPPPSRSPPAKRAPPSSAASTAPRSPPAPRRIQPRCSHRDRTPSRCARPTRQATTTSRRPATPSRSTPRTYCLDQLRSQRTDGRHHPDVRLQLERGGRHLPVQRRRRRVRGTAPRLFTTAALSDGPHTFSARAIDQAGNTDGTATTATSRSTPACPTPHHLRSVRPHQRLDAGLRVLL